MTYKAFKRGHKIFKKYGLNIAWLNFNKLDERVFILFFCEYINHTIWYLENTKNIDESLDKIIKVVKALLKMHDMLLIERRLNIIEIELVLNELKELDSRTKNFFEYVLERIKLTIFYLKVDAESIINDLGRGNSLINTRILFVLFFKEHIQIQNTEIGNVDYNRQGIINILQNYVCMNNDSKENYVYMNNDSKENYAYINDYSKISPFEFDLQKLEPSAKKKCILSILYYYIDVTQIDLNNNIEVKVNIQKMADIFTIIKFLKKIDISENLNLIRVLNMIVKLNLPGYLNIARIIQFPDKTKNEPIEYYYMTYKFMEEITFKYGYPHKIIKIRELNNNEQAMFYIEYLIIMIKVLKTLNNLPKYKKFKKEINNEIMRYKYLLSIELKNFK
jgi:hypothetical protein